MYVISFFIMVNSRLKEIIRESIFNTVFGNKKEKLDIEKIFHFSSIPTKELYSQYVDYSFDSSSSGFRYSEHLSEEVNLLQQATIAKSEMMRIYNMKDWQIQIKQGYHNVEVIILFANIFKNTKIIKEEMKRLGFFPSISAWQRRGFMIWRAIKFEPYEQEDLTREAKKFPYLFHVTPLYNHKSIAQNGLLPKSENNMFDYPDRVYILYGNIDKRNLMILAQQLYEKNRKTNKHNNGLYNVYAIDTRKLPDDVMFYGDPNYPKGYFTKQLIPSNCLLLVDTIQIRK